MRPPEFSPAVLTPRLEPLPGIRAVIFDVYGTLLLGGGPMVHRPDLDTEVSALLERHGFRPSGSPTRQLEAAAARHHATARNEGNPFPEIDLRAQIAATFPHPEHPAMASRGLVGELQRLLHPTSPMPGARELLHGLMVRGIPMGLISNAQCDTLPLLEETFGTDVFEPSLAVLSYEHGVAKPSSALFSELARRLGSLDIRPEETLVAGNDPRADILPAKAAGFRTALVAIDHGSLRPGDPATADVLVTRFSQLETCLDSRE